MPEARCVANPQPDSSIDPPSRVRRYDPARQIVTVTIARDAPGRDLTTEAGATVLARQIDAWWHARGFPQVRHWAERVPVRRGRKGHGSTTWVVRGNLAGGLPPKP